MKNKPIVQLPKLHTNQLTVFNDDTRFKVLVAGRRFGKSYLALAVALDLAVNHGKRVWWLSPTYKVNGPHWRNVKRMFAGKIYTDKSETDRRLEFAYNGLVGELSFKSGDRPDSLRGEGLDYLIIDEVAFVHPDIWYEVLRPALVDRQGGALFISTPNGRNWFHKLAMRGNDPQFTDWKTFHYTSYDNTAIPANILKAEVDSAKLDMPDLKFRQEHLAEFVDDVGSFFKGVHKVTYQPRLLAPEPNHIYTFGVDWGRKHDATVISVFDENDKKQVYVDRFTQVGWDNQYRHLMKLDEVFKPYKIYAEANSIGQPVIEQLVNLGMKNIEPFYMTVQSKAPLLDNLALKIELQEISLLSEDDKDGAVQADELKAFTAWQNQNGTWQYGAPEGYMDDTVIALALSVQGMRNRKPIMKQARNPFYPSKRVSKF